MHAVRLLLIGFLSAGMAAAEEAPPPVLPSLAALTAEVSTDPGERVDFGDQVRPILSDKCFACHGPDASARKADLRLDLEETAYLALKSGGHGIVPGKPGESQILERAVSPDPDDRMPPASTNKHLTENDVRVLARWIQQGAAWEGHWSFQRVERPAVPAVAQADRVSNPIDAYLLARLESEGLPPAPLADERTLIRRATLELTGLPPSPEAVEAYVADTAPDKYERLLDSLFQSPRYGEHMARYWMDAARYADTNGYHIDNERYMWRWRDWVIDSFQRNQPFDDFTVEQIAGDLLENATLEQRIASGFNRNHMINFEGGIIPEEYRVAYVMDRVNTTGTVWLGLTVSCAQCHSHKYDPISHEDYYKFYAYFNSIAEQGNDGLKGNSVPMIPAPRAEDTERIAAIEAQVLAARAKVEAPDAALDEAQAQWEREAHAVLRDRWQVARVDKQASAGGAGLDLLPDGSLLASGTNPDDEVYTVELESKLERVTAIRLEALTHESLSNQGAARSPNGNFVLTDFAVEVAGPDSDTWQPVKLVDAKADVSQENFPAFLAIDGDPATGWASGGHETPGARVIDFIPEYPINRSGGMRLRVTAKHESQFKQHHMGRFRLRLSEDNAFVKSRLDGWYLNGPFAAESGELAYDTAFPPEAGVNLTETYPDGRAKWNKLMRFEDGQVQPLDGGVAANYLYREIESPTARSYVVDVDCNDAFKLWVNGTLVHELKDGGFIKEGEYTRVTLPLQTGVNQVLLKAVNRGNRHEFYFAAVEEQANPLPKEVETALALRPSKRSDAQKVALLHYYRERHMPDWPTHKAELDKLAAELKTAQEAVPTTMVMGEMEQPRETFVLARGQYDAPTDKVEPGLPAVFPPLPEGAPNNRLGLAQWLVSRDNPLTARVTVNRIWQQVFGTGLVKTSEDFGTQGEQPTHPELLDWLAVEFMESGWNMQHLLKLMMTSTAYRQDSRIRPDALERDPENRLLARGPRFRMDAEMVRDNALAIAGLLVDKVGGPSVKPYQPPGIWEESAYGENFTAQRYEQDKGDALYRRTMYTFWKRQVPPPGLLLFDAPNREMCAVKRPRTNTPLQALALMNDPQYVEAARFLAERLISEGGESASDRIARGFLLSVGRHPKPEEVAVLVRIYEQQRARFAAAPESALALLKVGDKPASAALPPEELAAWTTVASAILNLDETVTKL
jgi:hypothetical protein